jgi:hypothetical protein
LDFFLLPLIRENKIFSVDREKKIKEYPPNHRFVHEYLQPLSEMMKLIGDRREKTITKMTHRLCQTPAGMLMQQVKDSTMVGEK